VFIALLVRTLCIALAHRMEDHQVKELAEPYLALSLDWSRWCLDCTRPARILAHVLAPLACTTQARLASGANVVNVARDRLITCACAAHVGMMCACCVAHVRLPCTTQGG